MPSNAIVASSAKSREERVQYQRFLNKLVERYTNFTEGDTQNAYDNPNRFGYRTRNKRQGFDPYRKNENPYDGYGNRYGQHDDRYNQDRSGQNNNDGLYGSVNR